MYGFALSRVMRASFSFSFSIYQQTLRRSCSGTLCVCVCVCVSVSASHTSFTHSHTPNTLDYAVKPCPQPILHPVCSIITHSFIFVFSLCLSYSISIGCLPGQMCNLHLIIIIETCFASL